MTPEAAHAARWDGRRLGWYEVWFVKCVDPASGHALWVRYTLRVPTRAGEAAETSLWGMFFDGADPARHLASKVTVPWTAARLAPGSAAFEIAGGTLAPGRATGETRSPDGRGLTWDLAWTPPPAPCALFPWDWMYSAPLPRTKYASPAHNVRMSGRITADGRTYTLASAPGQQAHLWGTQHAERWAWAHVNAFRDAPDAVFEALTAQVRVAGRTLPPLSVAFGDVEAPPAAGDAVHPLALRTTRASEVTWQARSRWELGRWELRVPGGDVRWRVELTAPLEDFLGVRYTDPGGEGLVCYHTELATARVTAERWDGAAWGAARTLVAERCAALEFVGRKPDPRVAVRI